MSTAAVEKQILRFLEGPDAGVVCIKGKWGVGKTFSWRRYLAAAHSAKKLSQSRYAYVSLFGINSLNDLKSAIFENTVDGKNIVEGPSFETFSEFLDTIKGVSRKQGWFTKAVAQALSLSEGLVPAIFLAIRNQIICFDDLERKSDDLDVGDILGMCSFLKEQRGCKVIILLNDEALDPESRSDFERYLEKVADMALQFAPSPQEATSIAIPTPTEDQQLIATNCKTLEITNIRLIQRIVHSSKLLLPVLKGSRREVIERCIRTLTLMSWCIFEPDRAPPLEFVLRWLPNRHLTKAEEEAIDEREAAWSALLDSYEFAQVDELDRVILRGIQAGFFEEGEIAGHTAVVEARLKARDHNNDFEGAWALYHNSFSENGKEIGDKMFAAFRATIPSRTLSDLSSTVSLLKDLGRGEEANALLTEYLAQPDRSREFFDLDDYMFPEYVKDPDVIQALKEKTTELADPEEGKNILQRIVERNGWSNEEISALAALPVADYVQIFKTTNGPVLRKMVGKSLGLKNFSNASPAMKKVAQLAHDALLAIGGESPLNARRVSKYGIAMPAAAPPQAGE